MIRLEGVTKRFGDLAVLSDISFEVPTGGSMALIGVGGAGKSLLFKLICGLVRPDAGRIWIDDDEVTALGETALMRVRGRIGMIFQSYALFDFMNVGGNVGFPLAQLRHVPRAAIRERVARRLRDVGLPGIEHLTPAELSGGMKKRVCLARATIHDPPILLCDDPTAGLDPVTTNRIFALLKQMQRNNSATALIASHEVDYLRPICEQFVMLDQGRLMFSGSPEDADRCDDPLVRQFMAGGRAGDRAGEHDR